MIISASRRTDLPSFYGEWFIRRVRTGWCDALNPFRPSQRTCVSLRPQDVDAIVFWTRNPTPFEPHLDELDRLGFRYYFLYTLTPYGPPLEPFLAPRVDRIAAFRRLAGRLGPDRVVWRYDPIILSPRFSADWHLEAFAALAGALHGATNRVTVSFLDFYRKTERRLAPIEAATGDAFCRDPLAHPELPRLINGLSALAREHGLALQTCAENPRLHRLGIRPGACVDAALINRIWKTRLPLTKDPGQRPDCRCTVSRDIGAVDSCRHGCAYCYSTRSHERAVERAGHHDPNASLLVPNRSDG